MSAYPGAIEGNSSRGVTPGLIDPTGPDVEANRVPLPDPKARKVNRQLRNAAYTAQGPSTASDFHLSEVESSSESSTADHAPEPTSTSNRRTSTDILADRLLIVATQGARALEPGASTNFEEWST